MKNQIAVIDLQLREDYCCICNALVIGGNKGIPMYEGIPVPHDWQGDWGGFCACEKCFALYETGALKTR